MKVAKVQSLVNDHYDFLQMAADEEHLKRNRNWDVEKEVLMEELRRKVYWFLKQDWPGMLVEDFGNDEVEEHLPTMRHLYLGRVVCVKMTVGKKIRMARRIEQMT